MAKLVQVLVNDKVTVVTVEGTHKVIEITRPVSRGAFMLLDHDESEPVNPPNATLVLRRKV